MPNQTKVIDRVKNLLDLLNNESKKNFVDNVFDVKNDTILIDLIENLESQIENKTITFNTISGKTAELISFDNYEKQELIISVDKLSESRKLTKIEEGDTRLYNNLVERLLGLNYDNLSLLKSNDQLYLTSINDLPERSNDEIKKEDAIIDSREIQYLFDRMIGENKDKQRYLNRILIDLITNQNYRILANGFGTLQSDAKSNEYYVLNGVTIKKELAFESIYRNYADEVKIITNLIVDNYDKILKIIEDIINSDNISNKEYFENLKKNICDMNDKSKVTKKLNAIEFGTQVDIYDNSRRNRNELFSEEIDSLSNSLNINKQESKLKINKELSNQGYASIFTLVSGIILFGIIFAYLIISR